MIANPEVAFYRYDPFLCKMLEEGYDHAEMNTRRNEAIA
jgi:hypothetical protein